MTDHVKAILANQFDAALCMLNDCVEKCPNALWDAPVAKYPYWLVTHHVPCFVDLYLSPTDASFVPREKFHPAGRRAFEDEYPSRRFERAEILEYIVICRQKAHDVFANATDASLLAPSGFARRPATRLELHLYNLRHLQHHAGQPGAVRAAPTRQSTRAGLAAGGSNGARTRIASRCHLVTLDRRTLCSLLSRAYLASLA